MDSYKKLLKKNVTASYQKTATFTLDRINAEAIFIAHNLRLKDRIESFPPRDVFITLKDHKENFRNYPKCRLINLAKSEIGKISKELLDSINVSVRKQSGLNQWRNTASTLNWFNAISDKPNCKFLMFDVVEFYPSITEKLLTDALNFANDYANINDEAISTIMHARKSLLFCDGDLWVKKLGAEFDVTMDRLTVQRFASWSACIFYTTLLRFLVKWLLACIEMTALPSFVTLRVQTPKE